MNSDELALKDEHEKFIANINRKTMEFKRRKIKNRERGGGEREIKKVIRLKAYANSQHYS